MNEDNKIAILGGTGPQGKGLAKRFALAGVPVVIGSRDSVRAAEVAAELNSVLPQGSANIEGMENLEATKMANEMVILSVPYSAHDATWLI